LVVVDAFIIVASGIASYFLAGKSLAPIEHAMSEQKRFVSDASHELRTPLTSIKTEIEVALRDSKLSIKEARSRLQSNLEEVDKMQSLTNYLLSLNRYENGDIELSKSPVDLAKVVDKVSRKYKTVVKDKGISVSQELLGVSIYANETAISELVSILLDNAIKYTPNGGSIRLETRGFRGHATFTISDTGIGIKKSEIPYIFNRFYRADTSRTTINADGYGLGLSIAKSIVNLHGGKIKVTSAPGSGTKFYITLPA
jgi:signal transduction histidine kinase